MRHILILTIDISAMLPPENIVCQMQLLIKINNKTKKFNGPHDHKCVSHRFHDHECVSHDFTLSNSILQPIQSIQKEYYFSYPMRFSRVLFFLPKMPLKFSDDFRLLISISPLLHNLPRRSTIKVPHLSITNSL